MTRRTLGALAAATAVAALAVPAAAQAHVRVLPTTAVAGSFTEFAVRVPTEKADASTVKVKVLFPSGFYFASYEPQAGWKTVIRKRKLATPVQTDFGPIDEEVSSVTWTGTGKGSGRIAPDAYKKFDVLVGVPADAAGKTLTFPSLQWYSDGDRVRWVGPQTADEPAPQVQVTAAAAARASRLTASPFESPVARIAHAAVEKRTPAAGASRKTVKQVKVTFAEAVVTGKISVTKGGKAVSTSSAGPSSSKQALVARFPRKLSKGSYKVTWSNLSDDGHKESGSWTFRVR